MADTSSPSSRLGKPRSSRACTHCKHAKTKCIKSGSENSCDRCLHFTLECMPPAPVIRRKRQPKPSRVEELEQKLDNIVALLTNSETQPQIAVRDQVMTLWPTTSDATGLSEQELESPESGLFGTNSSFVETQSQEEFPLLPDPAQIPDRIDVSTRLRSTFRPPQEDCDAILFRFGAEMTTHFPFVVLPPMITAKQLQDEKPFLFRAIVLAASKQDEEAQTEARVEILEYLAEHLLLRGEKTLDLLQGLLIFMAWNIGRNYQFHTNAQRSVLLQMAVALVGELGLDRIPRRQGYPQTSLVDVVEPKGYVPHHKTKCHTSDEMRAVAGCFYLTSVLYQCYKKSIAMKYTPYLEHCCKTLDAAAEYPTDILVTHLVRIQAIYNRAADALIFTDFNPASSHTLVEMLLKSSQNEIRQYRSSLPTESQYQQDLLLHSYCIELTLLETGVYETPEPGASGQNLRQAERLLDCLLAAKAFFDAWFHIPVSSYGSYPIVVWAQIANTTVIASRLLLFESSNWDLKHARHILDFPETLGRVAQKVEEISLSRSKEDAEHVLQRYAQRVRWVKGWFEARLAEKAVPLSQTQVMVPTMGNLSLDDVFWQEFMEEWSSMPGLETTF